MFYRGFVVLFSVIRPGREPMSMDTKKKSPPFEEAISQSEHSLQATAPKSSSAAQGVRSRSPGLSNRVEGPGRSQSPYGASKSESLRTKSPVDKTK